MDGERIQHDLGLIVVAYPTNENDPAVAINGRLVAYEDGRWRLFLAGAEAARGGRDEGGREAVAALLRVLTAAANESPLPPLR